jgi:hypothetical protein
MSYCNVEQEEGVRIKAAGQTFINGFPSQFSKDFPRQLESLLPESVFEDLIEKVNRTLEYYWPCQAAVTLGYLCLPCTCGLSLLVPRVCIQQAEQAVTRKLRHFNAHVLAKHKLEARLEWQGCNCYIFVKIIHDF